MELPKRKIRDNHDRWAASSASNAVISASMAASLLLRLVLAAAISDSNAVISASLAARSSVCLVLAVGGPVNILTGPRVDFSRFC